MTDKKTPSPSTPQVPPLPGMTSLGIPEVEEEWTEERLSALREMAQWPPPGIPEPSEHKRLHGDICPLCKASKRILESLEWEEDRSGTTYHGYEELKEAVSKLEKP